MTATAARGGSDFTEAGILTRIISVKAHEALLRQIAELERENDDLKRQNRVWEWRVDQIIRFIDGKPETPCPE